MITMPYNSSFTVKCSHCDRDTKKNPSKHHKDKTQEMILLFCGKCKQSTLIRVDCDNTVATIFKVES